MKRRPTAWLIPFALISGCASQGKPASQRHFLAHDPPRAASFDAMIRQSAIHPEQNIHQLLLHQSDSMSVYLVRIRDREQPHLHTRYDLSIVLVEGEGTLWLQGEPLKMKPGDVAVVSKGTRHHFINEGSEPAAALVVFAPAYEESDREAVDEPE
jgi:mannose-6-phosphate isomerase-like protein (cupin superfamily)